METLGMREGLQVHRVQVSALMESCPHHPLGLATHSCTVRAVTGPRVTSPHTLGQ